MVSMCFFLYTYVASKIHTSTPTHAMLVVELVVAALGTFR